MLIILWDRQLAAERICSALPWILTDGSIHRRRQKFSRGTRVKLYLLQQLGTMGFPSTSLMGNPMLQTVQRVYLTLTLAEHKSNQCILLKVKRKLLTVSLNHLFQVNKLLKMFSRIKHVWLSSTSASVEQFHANLNLTDSYINNEMVKCVSSRWGGRLLSRKG